MAWRGREHTRRELRVALLAGLVTAFLAVLGASMAGSVLPAYALANLTGGFVLVAIFAAAWRVSACGAAPADATRRMAIIALVLLLLQTELGGLLGVHHALATCARLGECAPSWQSLVQSRALDLFQRPAWTDARTLDAGAAATLHLAHRALGAALAILALLMAASLDGPLEPLRWVLGGLITVALILGFVGATVAGPLLFVVLHNAVAALLAALFTWLATRPHPS
jgi:heme A synthase